MMVEMTYSSLASQFLRFSSVAFDPDTSIITSCDSCHTSDLNPQVGHLILSYCCVLFLYSLATLAHSFHLWRFGETTFVQNCINSCLHFVSVSFMGSWEYISTQSCTCMCSIMRGGSVLKLVTLKLSHPLLGIKAKSQNKPKHFTVSFRMFFSTFPSKYHLKIFSPCIKPETLFLLVGKPLRTDHPLLHKTKYFRRTRLSLLVRRILLVVSLRTKVTAAHRPERTA